MKILFAKLKNLGYAAFLEDPNIRLKYLGVGKQPPEALPIIEELRARKSEAVEFLKSQRPLPFFDADGGLVIPFGSESRYHYWQGGQSIEDTEREVKSWLH